MRASSQKYASSSHPDNRIGRPASIASLAITSTPNNASAFIASPGLDVSTATTNRPRASGVAARSNREQAGPAPEVFRRATDDRQQTPKGSPANRNHTAFRAQNIG